jgi:hypothetical protein
MNTQPQPEEQRKDRRRTLQTTASMVLPGHAPTQARTINISRGGLGLVAAANPPANAVVSVRFALPMPGARPVPIEVSARVIYSVLSRRHDDFTIGLRFLSPSPQVLDAIEAFIDA